VDRGARGASVSEIGERIKVDQRCDVTQGGDIRLWICCSFQNLRNTEGSRVKLYDNEIGGIAVAKIVKDKKEIIAEAAVKVIAREGFHNATIDKIAASAGVAVGTIYNYFSTKNDILDYIFQREFEKRKQYFLEIQKQGLHPLEQIKRILTMHFEEVKDNPDVFIVLLRERGIPKICHFEGIAQFEGLPRFIEESLTEGINSGTLRPCDTRVMAATVFGAIESLMGRYLLEVEEKGHSTLLDNAAGEIAMLLQRGLGC